MNTKQNVTALLTEGNSSFQLVLTELVILHILDCQTLGFALKVKAYSRLNAQSLCPFFSMCPTECNHFANLCTFLASKW